MAAALLCAVSAVPFVHIAPPAMAQNFSDSYLFLKAVKEFDGTKVNEMLSEPGTVIINTKERNTGRTALHIVVESNNSTWVGFLLQKGANPNIADKEGMLPLMLATQYGNAEAVDWLIRYKADVDGTNRGGETALMRAVQLRNKELVTLLLNKGANPDRTDSVTGLSAREYAVRDGRSSGILAIIEDKSADKDAATTDGKNAQGKLDFSVFPSPE
ncbi:hypothetical protein LPB140_00635 [Sphingorhabdus lutea]|uniref:Ankyrin repeat domain-containing protein n=2 Tax=Sphingorhabdus lutea TaxID=1913578 RepID=A0A1L3JE78_9SPHN|nr:hypothetical protein LPB140_00635 [Sphingorhabdus lutea]